MTGRAVILLLIAASALYAARNVGVGWLYALGYSLAAGVLASAASGAWTVWGVRMTVAPGRTTEAGQPLPVAVTLENRGSRTRRYLSLLAGPLGTRARLWPWRRGLVPAGWGTILIPELKPGDRLTLQLPVPAPRRGLHALPAIYLQAAPLGLVACFKSWKGRASGNPAASRVRGNGPVMVHPRTHAMGNLAWLERGRGAAERDNASRPEDGGELTKAVRPYRSGDAMRQIHWKTTARTGQLSVRESEGDAPGQELVIVLDAAAEARSDAFEIALEVAASLLTEAQACGMEARLIGGEPQGGGAQSGDPKGRGPATQTLRAQLDWLATLDASASRALPPLPVDGRRVVVITTRPEVWAGRAEACIRVAPGQTIKEILEELP